MRMLANISDGATDEQGQCSRLTTITLQPLQLLDTIALVKDTLRSTEDAALDLARLIQLKARGNAFFINQILQSFHSDRHLTFDYAKVRRTYWQ